MPRYRQTFTCQCIKCEVAFQHTGYSPRKRCEKCLIVPWMGTLDEAIVAAKAYSTLDELRDANKPLLLAVRRNRWASECYSHMKNEPRVKLQKGDIYGYLEFTGDYINKDRRHYGVFNCLKCGKLVEYRTDRVRNGEVVSCGCLDPTRNQSNNKERYGTDYGFYVVWERFRKSANTRHLVFELTPEDIKATYNLQNGECFYSGHKLDIPKNFCSKWLNNPKNVSIDRIDPKQGYTKGNIRLVSKNVNFSKYTMSHDEYIALCREVANKHNE